MISVAARNRTCATRTSGSETYASIAALSEDSRSGVTAAAPRTSGATRARNAPIDAWNRRSGVHSTSQHGAARTHPANLGPNADARAHACAATSPPKLTPPTKTGTAASAGYLARTSLRDGRETRGEV